MPSDWFRGDYASWDEAVRASGTYEEGAILERVVGASRRVRDGQAAYERDGIAFLEPEDNQRLLRALDHARPPAPRPLRVLDFGGALGSHYWQHRAHFEGSARVAWRIVEQAHYVTAGEREFLTSDLSFWPSMPEACRGWPPDLVVASGVLQCLPDPYGVLQELVGAGSPWLFLDRLPLLPGDRDRLTVEHVPPDIGSERYPAWFLAEAKVLAAIEAEHEVVERSATTLQGGVPERWDVFGITVQNQALLARRR